MAGRGVTLVSPGRGRAPGSQGARRPSADPGASRELSTKLGGAPRPRIALRFHRPGPVPGACSCSSVRCPLSQPSPRLGGRGEGVGTPRSKDEGKWRRSATNTPPHPHPCRGLRSDPSVKPRPFLQSSSPGQ